MAKNEQLNKAKKEKNDEFYTRMEDIEKEVIKYKDQLENKVIFMNCDDPMKSNFWKYFALNFDKFKLKKLISTHFDPKINTYKLEMTDSKNIVKTALNGNGDFRNQESIDLLKEADIVITNPPFSLFREYLDQILQYNKKFLIIGSKDAITYKDVFQLFKDKKIHIGYTKPTEYNIPEYYKDMKGVYEVDGKLFKKVGTLWWTNLDVKKRSLREIFIEKYDPQRYPKFDNCDAIYVDKIRNIPIDYDGIMGVPTSYAEIHNEDEFEIIGNEYDLKLDKGRAYLNGQRKYAKIFIKWRRK